MGHSFFCTWICGRSLFGVAAGISFAWRKPLLRRQRSKTRNGFPSSWRKTLRKHGINPSGKPSPVALVETPPPPRLHQLAVQLKADTPTSPVWTR